MVHHFKRELIVKKILQWNVIENRKPTCLTGTKKNMHKKRLPNPPLKNLMVRPLRNGSLKVDRVTVCAE